MGPSIRTSEYIYYIYYNFVLNYKGSKSEYLNTLRMEFKIHMAGWKDGLRRHLMGLVGVRTIIGEASR